jgi:endonuclease YncB( thermonuclease family)
VASPYYLAIKGDFVIKGKKPDGDSLRFIAHNLELYRLLQRAYRIKVSRDGSVQLRLEGVDAPELHYGTHMQPLGEWSRDTLLAWLGFQNIVYEQHRVTDSTPLHIPGAILTQAAEVNGRPISYILIGPLADGLQDGTWTLLDPTLLQQTLNFTLLREGTAYYTTYTSTYIEHRRLLRDAAVQARSDLKGVWREDQTNSFQLVNQDSIGPQGQLLLPKLFRRCTDYLKDVENGYDGNLPDWLVWISQSSRDENDMVVIQDALEIPLSDLILQQNQTVRFQVDLLDIVFVEK